MNRGLLKKESIIGRRIGAFLTDNIFITLIAMIPFLLNFNKFTGDVNYIFGAFPIIMIIAISCYLLKDIFSGRSLGKILFGIYVKKYHDIEEAPPLNKLIIRNILIFIWPIEFVIMLFDKEGRRLGDKLSKTQVIGYSGKIVFRIVIAGILAFALFITSSIIGVTQLIRNDSSYKTAVQYIQNQDQIKSVTGGIKGFGNFPMGSINSKNGHAVADLKIKVKGIKKNIVVNVYLEKTTDSNWSVKDIDY